MSEPTLIIPYCCFSGKYCSSNNLFVEGYALGLLTIIFILLIIVTIDMCVNDDIDSKNSDSDSDSKNMDKETNEKNKEE